MACNIPIEGHHTNQFSLNLPESNLSTWVQMPGSLLLQNRGDKFSTYGLFWKTAVTSAVVTLVLEKIASHGEKSL